MIKGISDSIDNSHKQKDIIKGLIILYTYTYKYVIKRI